MAPGTRANPERGDEASDDLNVPEIVQVPTSPDHGSSLREEAEVTPGTFVNNQSRDASTMLRMEQLESSMSQLLKAFEYLQEKHVSEACAIASVPQSQHLASLEDEGVEEEHLSTHQAPQGTFVDSGRHAARMDHAASRMEVNASRPFSGDYEIYPTHIAYKIYQKGLQSTRCRSIGDGSFFVAKRCWDRLAADFPTTQAGMKRLLPLAFDGDARLVYEEIASFNSDVSCEKLWELLSKRLCNEIHQSALRDRFFAMYWNEKIETFEKYAWRLRSASLLLPDVIDDGLLLNRLKNGLPNRLQDQAKLVSGTFDEVVCRVATLSTAKGNRSEMVREVRENGGTEKSRDGMLREDRFASFRCHYCQKLGHISRDCEKKKSDRAKQEKGRADQQSPAGPSPKHN